MALTHKPANETTKDCRIAVASSDVHCQIFLSIIPYLSENVHIVRTIVLKYVSCDVVSAWGGAQQKMKNPSHENDNENNSGSGQRTEHGG